MTTTQNTRREMLKGSLAVAGLESVLACSGLGDSGPGGRRDTRALHRHARKRRHGDRRRATASSTSARSMARSRRGINSSRPSTTAIPQVDPRTYRLRDHRAWWTEPRSCSLDDLRRMGGAELVAGFECSGNRRPLQGLCSQRQVDGRSAQTLARSGWCEV